MFSVTEDLVPPRRLLRQKKTGAGRRRATAIFRPGAGRGAVYMLAQMALFLIAGWSLASTSADLRWLLAICGYTCFFTGVPACAGRLLAPVRATADYLRVAGLLFFPVMSLFADLLYYLLTPSHIFDGVYSVYHVLNPFRTLANWTVVERNHWDFL